MVMESTKELINIATIHRPLESLFTASTGSEGNRYIRLKRSATVYSNPVARFFMQGITTRSTLNIPGAETHDISIYAYEPAFFRIMAVVGEIYGIEEVCIPIWGGDGMTFKTFKSTGKYKIINTTRLTFSSFNYIQDKDKNRQVSLGSLSLPSTPIKSAKASKYRPPVRSSLNYEDTGISCLLSYGPYCHHL